MTLTVGTNSYINVADADAYFAERLHSDAWTASDTSTKEAALIQATRLIDNIYDWYGELADETQSLGWPRSGAYDCEGREIDATIIPDAIANATCELAINLIKNDVTATPTLLQGGFRRAKLGTMEIEVDSAMKLKTIDRNVKLAVGCLGEVRKVTADAGASSGTTIRR